MTFSSEDREKCRDRDVGIIVTFSASRDMTSYQTEIFCYISDYRGGWCRLVSRISCLVSRVSCVVCRVVVA